MYLIKELYQTVGRIKEGFRRTYKCKPTNS